jgi:hypothetical protein
MQVARPRPILFGLLATFVAATAFGSEVPDGRPSGASGTPAPATPADDHGASLEPEWYGWQTLTVDGVALAGGIAAAAALDFPPRERPSAPGVVAASWYGLGALAAPAVHYAHGRMGVGIGDFGVRLVLPPTTGFVAWLTLCTVRGRFDRDCARTGWVAGSFAGLAGAAALDAAFFAWRKPGTDAEPTRSWYGWQMLALDAGAVGFGASLALSNPRTNDGDKIHPALPTWALGFTLGLLTGPIVHFAHGRWGIGFVSLGARALIGPLGAVPGLVGYCAATGGVHDCAAVGAQWGLLGGLVAVSLFDALVLAYEPAPEKPTHAMTLFVGPGTIGIAGSFP